MTNYSQAAQDYARIASAIQYLHINATRQPSLSEVASSINLSEYHFQRLFTRWAGISPKRFLQFLTKEYVKHLLERSSVLSASHASGLSSPGRLHDLLIHTEAVTPGEYRSHGSGLTISYGFHPSPFGECLLASTSRGICFLGFVQESRAIALRSLASHWHRATLLADSSATSPLLDRIFSPDPASPLSIHLSGTNFQIKVWEALLSLPSGSATSYSSLARQVNSPHAARAVGQALGQNPLAYLIPCHRVLQQVGNFGNYRYGAVRKQAILLYESAHADLSG